MKHIVFVLNVPAFYKINLLNKLSEYFSITAIILGTTDQVVKDEVYKNCKFSIKELSKDDMDNKWRGVLRIPRLIRTLRRIEFDYIVYSGWDNIDMIAGAFFTPRYKNCVISESSIFESVTKGIKGLIKKIIISRYSKAFPSGIPHKELLDKLNFKGETYITGSVGINTPLKRKIPSSITSFRFLFIGRLIEIKNVDLLVDVFNETGKNLTIVGTGLLETKLKAKSKNNIKFNGFVSREDISKIINDHQCLILPSKREPWGLVVEEALQSGIPVIASDKVGSSLDLIEKYNSGIVFENNSKDDLVKALCRMEQNYEYYRRNALKIDFTKRERKYIDSFIEAFKG